MKHLNSGGDEMAKTGSVTTVARMSHRPTDASQFIKNHPNRGTVKTQLTSIVLNSRGGPNKDGSRIGRDEERVKAMCGMSIDTMTLSGLLEDQLTQLVMRSDGVSEEDFSALMYRMRDTLAARALAQSAADAAR